MGAKKAFTRAQSDYKLYQRAVCHKDFFM